MWNTGPFLLKENSSKNNNKCPFSLWKLVHLAEGVELISKYCENQKFTVSFSISKECRAHNYWARSAQFFSVRSLRERPAHYTKSVKLTVQRVWSHPFRARWAYCSKKNIDHKLSLNFDISILLHWKMLSFYLAFQKTQNFPNKLEFKINDDTYFAHNHI